MSCKRLPFFSESSCKCANLSVVFVSLTEKELASKVFTEEDWSIEEHCLPYPKSKLKAEQAAWEYVKSVPDRNLELVVINPCYILGPLLSKYGGDNSRTLITRLLKNDMPGLPTTFLAIVDVRDVANAHVIALTHPNAPGNRYICCSDGLWMKDVASILRAEFTPKGYKIPNIQIPNAIVWVVSLWDTAAENIYPRLGKKDLLSSEKIKTQFGIEFRDSKQTIIDMANDIIKYTF